MKNLSKLAANIPLMGAVFVVTGCAPNITDDIWPRTLGFGANPAIWSKEASVFQSDEHFGQLRKQRREELDDAAAALASKIHPHSQSTKDLTAYLERNEFQCTAVDGTAGNTTECSAVSSHQYNIYGVAAPNPPFEVHWIVAVSADSHQVKSVSVQVRDPNMPEDQIHRLHGCRFDPSPGTFTC